MKVLLTNDDGYESPLYIELALLLKQEDWISELQLVAPYKEQSWIGTAISRHSAVKVEQIVFKDLNIFSVYGTPGDCATIGSFNLSPTPPDLVISGINFGSNAGSAFCFSSGTLGAARQAAFLGIPGIACSALLEFEIYSAWRDRDFKYFNENISKIKNIANHHLGFIKKVLQQNYFKNKEVKTDYISINSAKLISSNELHLASVKDTNYIPFFDEVSPGNYIHKFKGFDEERMNTRGGNAKSDIDLLNQGKNTYSLFDLRPGVSAIESMGEIIL